MSFKSKQGLQTFGSLIRFPEPESGNLGEEGDLIKIRMKSKSEKLKRSQSLPDGDEVQEENGVLFWVNKSGFPIEDRTWQRMWDHVAKIHPEGHKMVQGVRQSKELVTIPAPQAPLSFSPTVPIGDRVEKIQNYMTELQYNHTGTQFFEIRKNRPISGLMECAKEMIRESLPIKCLEAVILGIYLTNGMMGVERYPISFKSTFQGSVHRHVVLGISHGGRYGAIGMSRREDLMYKPLVFKSLSDLVFDFEKAYTKYWHEVRKVKVGLPSPHDPHSYETVQWKTLTLNVSKLSRKEMTRELEQHSKLIRAKAKSWSTPPNLPKKMATFIDAGRDMPGTSKSSPTVKMTRSHSVVTKSREEPASVKSGSSRGADYQIRI
ncbi:tubulinyl-Tyr carboxypeptidase 1-like [Haliotis cracherodii]|uniref:tubulinyl-Tyr carboxypeptidase 1-like n=1 Tax=Haliotis rufescens TaxID=6454 RepID=UPI001EB00973|nr:tubulinyl-Tyr carboxypeptidase 1-like [Haliotis rufescens]